MMIKMMMMIMMSTMMIIMMMLPPVKEVLIEDGVIVGQGLREAGEARGGDLLEGGLVRLEADAAHVQRDPVLAVCHHRHRWR